MLSLTIVQLFLCHLVFVVVNCDNLLGNIAGGLLQGVQGTKYDNLLVNTGSGPIKGVQQTTLLNKVTYAAFKGIPYAEVPIGKLRFKSPRPVKPWKEPLLATQYGDACLVIDQSQLFPLNTTQSEDCLTLNIFTPVLGSQRLSAKKAVMFFIHGGAFTEGDGTDGFYGPDFLIEKDVVLVTFNYRLGPWGFANFDLKGYTGNMGLKDQQAALEWTKKNIKYFGGDPNLITIFGESAGGTSVHLQVLNAKSRSLMKRAIAMSGVTFDHFSNYQPDIHIELIKQVFNLNKNATASDVLEFMQTASTDLILEKSPGLAIPQGIVDLYWAPVNEDPKKAENPFLIKNPQEIYRTENIDTDVMFGVNSAEFLLFIGPPDYYNWIEPLKNYSNIGLPFNGLTLQPNSSLYQKYVKKIYSFYFGSGTVQPTPSYMNKYVQMGTDANFYYGVATAAKTHSLKATTYCYQNDMSLNLNFIKIYNGLEQFKGTAHFEDLLYLFYSKKYAQLYVEVLANPTDPKNKKTLAAIDTQTKFITDYAKTGSPGNFEPFTQNCPNFIHVTNNGLESIRIPNEAAVNFWDDIYCDLKPYIKNAF